MDAESTTPLQGRYQGRSRKAECKLYRRRMTLLRTVGCIHSTLLSDGALQMLPPIAKPINPTDAIPAKHLHSSLNKARHAVNVVRWTPEGRRLLTGSYSGEFTLWNGTAFNFETIMQVRQSTTFVQAPSHLDELGTRCSNTSGHLLS